MDWTYLSNRALDNQKVEEKFTMPMSELNSKIIECQEKIRDIKYKVDDINEQWKSLTEDYSMFSFAKSLDVSIRESFQKAIDDLKAEYDDVKSTLDYYKKLKSKTLLESGIEESDIEDNKDIDKVEEVLVTAKQQVKNGESSSDVLETLFREFVPASGKSHTVGGELVRAMMRILYRFASNKELFYDGEGLRTCGPEAQYLINVAGYIFEFNDIIDLHKDGNDYQTAINEICDLLVEYLLANPDLFVEPNTVDSRKVSTAELESMLPKLNFIRELDEKLIDLIESDEVKPYDIIEEIYSEFAPYIEEIDNVTIDMGIVNISDLTSVGLFEIENHFDTWEESYLKKLDSDEEDK